MECSLSMDAWRKSSYSGQSQNCVEVAGGLRGAVAVRDSKDPDGPTLLVAPTAWQALARRVRDGRYVLGASSPCGIHSN
jgi:hypothetical protein